jgi:redox-sensitive bicupin YhaK (pirin superfamily)
VRFGPLRVLNDDTVAGGGGFPTHPHRDAEVITYVLNGALEHRDSTGQHDVIRPFEIQRMRAGRGITHSEFNASPTEPVHLLQMWVLPAQSGLEPGYASKTFDPEARHGRFLTVITPDGADGTVDIAQDASMHVAHLEPGESAPYSLEKGRLGYLHVATGAVELNGQPLRAGDGAKVSAEDTLNVTASETSELVLCDLPNG